MSITFAVRKIIVLFFLLGLVLAVSYCNSEQILDDKNPKAKDYYFSLIREAYWLVKTNYIHSKKAGSKKLFLGGIKGMFQALDDPYSVFLDDKIMAPYLQAMKGKFGGLGISIKLEDKKIIIIMVMPNSPAQKAGLRPGDEIIAINGKATKKMTLEKVIMKLRGKPKSKVKLTILRPSGNQKFTKSITREAFKTIDVVYRVMKKKIGYIWLRQFSPGVAGEFKVALLDMKKRKIKGIIVDLRNNPGGSLGTCLRIMNYFLKGGLKLTSMKMKNEKEGDDALSNSRHSIFKKLPLVVLANNHSASASEVFIGAMQDYKRGTIIGTKTFGKGSAHTYELSNVWRKVLYQATLARWYTPHGRLIHKKGIQPDITVKEPKYTLDEKYCITKLIRTKELERFVKNHPSLSSSDINQFMKLIKSKGLKLKRIQAISLLKSEQYSYKIGPPWYPRYDRTLRKGWEFLTKSKYK